MPLASEMRYSTVPVYGRALHSGIPSVFVSGRALYSGIPGVFVVDRALQRYPLFCFWKGSILRYPCENHTEVPLFSTLVTIKVFLSSIISLANYQPAGFIAYLNSTPKTTSYRLTSNHLDLLSPPSPNGDLCYSPKAREDQLRQSEILDRRWKMGEAPGR